MSFHIHYDDIIQTQVGLRCKGSRCEQWYHANKQKINEVLQKYEQYLPIVFVSDMPELDNLYAEIINHDCFEVLCLDCSLPIVQLYNMTNENFLKKITNKTKKSLCYN